MPASRKRKDVSMTIPARMTAIAIREPGPPDVLVPEMRDTPAPKQGEVLVKVAAAGVNRPDVMQREGKYPPPPGAPDIPGLELAGEVVALGDGVARWKLGDKVTALVPGGGYAEYAAVHESNALPVIAPLTMAEAGAIPETFFTVWHNVFERGDLAGKLEARNIRRARGRRIFALALHHVRPVHAGGRDLHQHLALGRLGRRPPLRDQHLGTAEGADRDHGHLSGQRGHWRDPFGVTRSFRPRLGV